MTAHEKLLLGGIWAIIEMEYDPMITIGATVFPFVVKDIKPIQLSNFDNTRVIEKEPSSPRMNGKPYCLEVQGMNQAVKALMIGYWISCCAV